jgi:hypothetical protein
MSNPRLTLGRYCAALAAALLLTPAARPQNVPVSLHVDLTDAPRKLLHAQLRLPAKPGPLTLLYPKSIPGEHGPNGPITDLAGLKMTAAGKPVPWRRDPIDMFAFHVDVPDDANAIDVALDFLLPPSTGAFSSSPSATAELLVENEDYFKTCTVDYHNGEKYPQPEWEPGKRDLLSEILRPLTPRD